MRYVTFCGIILIDVCRLACLCISCYLCHCCGRHSRLLRVLVDLGNVFRLYDMLSRGKLCKGSDRCAVCLSGSKHGRKYDWLSTCFTISNSACPRSMLACPLYCWRWEVVSRVGVGRLLSLQSQKMLWYLLNHPRLLPSLSAVVCLQKYI